MKTVGAGWRLVENGEDPMEVIGAGFSLHYKTAEVIIDNHLIKNVNISYSTINNAIGY
jgi:hypothetical protein